MFGLEARILEIERRLKEALQAIRDILARIARLENNQWNQTAGTSGGDGGGGGVFYADHVVITVNTSVTGITVRESWTTNITTTNGTVHNAMPDPTTGTKRQLLGKNPDGSYTVIGESCTPV